jgi:hypothetical protein
LVWPFRFLATAVRTYDALISDVNRKDYRAWYGLGQAYELLNMHQYALYYFQQATALRLVSRLMLNTPSLLSFYVIDHMTCGYGKRRLVVTGTLDGEWFFPL